MESEIIPISKEILAHDFRNAMVGYLDNEKIEEAIKKIMSDTPHYRSDAQVAGVTFYVHVQCQVRNGKHFNGEAGAFPGNFGGGAFGGNLYSDDIDKLYAETHHFEFHVTAVYLGINYFDKHFNFLGHFEGGGVSNLLTGGKGKGHWK